MTPGRPMLRQVHGALAAAAGLAALGAAALGAAAAHRVTMKDVDYAPGSIRVRIGETVEWTNDDPFAHTATAEDGSWDIDLAPGRSGDRVMASPGRIPYFCRYHPNMRGEILVEK